MKPSAHAALAALAALLVAGCMIGPDYRRPETTLPAQFPGDAASDAPSTVRPDWWTLWNDPTLATLVQDALASNTDVEAAAARVEEAEAVLRQAQAALFPEIDLNGNASRARAAQGGRVAGAGNVFAIGLSTSFELDFWGRLRRLVESARAQALGTRYASDTVALSIAGLVTQSYFSLRSLDAQIEATRGTLSTRSEYFDLVRRRAEGGVANDLELNQARGQRAEAAAQLEDLTRQRELAQHLIGVLTGRLDRVIPPASIEALPVPAMPPPGLPSTLVERRPDVQQAEQNLAATTSQVAAARAALLPTFGLTGSGGLASTALSTLVRSSSLIGSIGLGLSLPLLDAGRRQAEVEQARARQREALAAYEGSIRTAFREVSDALSNIGHYAAEETHLRESVDAARNSLRLAALRYESGYSPFLDVLDAQRTINVAELAYIRNRQALLSAEVDLLRALGGGWDPTTPIATSVSEATAGPGSDAHASVPAADTGRGGDAATTRAADAPGAVR